MTDTLKAAALNAAVKIIDLSSIPDRKDRIRQVTITALSLVRHMENTAARRAEKNKDDAEDLDADDLPS